MVAVTPCCSVEKGLGEKVQVSSPQGRRSVLTLCLVLNYCNQVLSRLRDVCYLQKTSPGVLTAENSLPLCVTFACNLIKSPQKPYWLSEWDVKGKKKKVIFWRERKEEKRKITVAYSISSYQSCSKKPSLNMCVSSKHGKVPVTSSSWFLSLVEGPTPVQWYVPPCMAMQNSMVPFPPCYPYNLFPQKPSEQKTASSNINNRKYRKYV